MALSFIVRGIISRLLPLKMRLACEEKERSFGTDQWHELPKRKVGSCILHIHIHKHSFTSNDHVDDDDDDDDERK